MSTRESDVTAARRAADELVQAVSALRPHYGDSVDMKRLSADAERIAADLDLLVGPRTASPSNGDDVVLVPDTSYPDGFFADAEDEGIGGRR